jgi:hypothetical protein
MISLRARPGSGFRVPRSNASRASRPCASAICPWDAQLAYSGLKPEPGRTYVVDYRLWTSAPTDVRIKLGLDAPPYSEYWLQNVAASDEPRRVTDQFVLAEPASGTLALGFQFAGYYASKVPITLCIDEVSLTLAPKR